jgi:tetratricopeptide (TPR) repeat protein
MQRLNQRYNQASEMAVFQNRPRVVSRIFAAALLSHLLVLMPRVGAQQSSSSSDQTASQQNPPAQNPPPKAKPKPAPDDNAFPEDISRKAEQQKKTADQPGADQTPPPDATGQAPSTSQSGADNNAFPEEKSRRAEDASKSSAESSSSSGVSSSSDYDDRVTGGRNAVVPNVPMNHIHTRDQAKEDVYVGNFYLQSGDFVGAYARFKEASTLRPENVEAMFGLAEAARHLKKNDEALENYRLYLDVVPNGPKAKDARKALASLEKPH